MLILYTAAAGMRRLLSPLTVVALAKTASAYPWPRGPEVNGGFDLALTEIVDAERHVFVVEVGSERGARILDDIPHRVAEEHDIAQAHAVCERARNGMEKEIDTDGIKHLLYRNVDYARWEVIAQRCLNCANCTMVCPTCFCMTVEDVTDLTGEQAERVRRWDSCFTQDFSYLHGGSVRMSGKSRYRHWMMHKLATWVDQFDSPGCVGCGRCIAWCPVGIDLTEEARALRENDSAAVEATPNGT